MVTKFQKAIYKFCNELSKHLQYRLIKRNDGKPYLERYYILRGRRSGFLSKILPGIYLHKFLAGDEDPELHNHPWGHSISVILCGKYLEERRTKDDKVKFKVFEAGNVNYIKKNDFHRIELDSREVWTLFISGTREQDWGFWNQKTGEYTQWEEHIRKKKVANEKSKRTRKSKTSMLRYDED